MRARPADSRRPSRRYGVGDHVARRSPRRLGGEHEPVGQDRLGERLHIVGKGVVAPGQHRVRLGGAQQHQPGPGAGAEVDPRVLARAPQQAHDVIAQRRGGPNPGGGILGRQHLGGGHDGRQRQHLVTGLVGGEHPRLGRAVRIAKRDPDHEPVHLGFGQRIGALVLDRVLGRQDQEGPRQLVGVHIDGDPPLLHALEQSGLGLGGGSVDLVDQHHVGEHRPGPELEALLALVIDVGADEVGRQQVRGALHARELTVDRARQRPGQSGLADTRIVLDEHVTLGQQGDDQVSQRLLAHLHRLVDVGREGSSDGGEGLKLLRR